MSQKIGNQQIKKQIITREEERRDYKTEKVWLIEKNSGMIWNRGEDFEKQQQNHDDILSPPSLKKHRLEEHPERPPLESKESKNAGFWAHYTKSAQVYSQGSSLRSLLLKRKVTVNSSFLLPQDVFSRQSSGTSIWVLQVTVSLPASKSPLSSLLIVLYRRQTQPSILTPQRAERYYLHLALWLPESTCNRPTGPNGTRLNSIAPPTLPTRLVCPGKEML